ncbi:hypothetical protein D3C77_660980 [compost metagenome]
MIPFERRWYGDQERIGRQRFRHRLQITAFYRFFYHAIQIRFDDVDGTAVNGIYRVLVNIYAHHFFLAGSKRRRRWQTNIAQANN